MKNIFYIIKLMSLTGLTLTLALNVHAGNKSEKQELAPLPSTCGTYPEGENDLGRILKDNTEALQARASMVYKANCEILVTYYTIASDEVAIAGFASLIQAATKKYSYKNKDGDTVTANIKIKVLMDGLSHQVDRALAAAVLNNGWGKNIEIRTFKPFFLFDTSTWFNRLHDKLLVVDGLTVLSGGRNISEKYFGFAKDGFFDIDTMLIGSIGGKARKYFYQMWNREDVVPFNLGKYKATELNKECDSESDSSDYLCWAESEHNGRQVKKYQQELTSSISKIEIMTDDNKQVLKEEDITMELVEKEIENYMNGTSPLVEFDPDYEWFDFGGISDNPAFENNGPIEVFYDNPNNEKSREHGISGQMEAFFRRTIKPGAQLTIFTPYMILGEHGQKLIKALRNKNISVIVYTNSAKSSDNVFAQGVYRHKDSKNFLLKNGVGIWESKGTETLHLKGAIIKNPGEDEIFLLGTYNVDTRSAYLNHELVAAISPKSEFMYDMTNIFFDIESIVKNNGYEAGMKEGDPNYKNKEWWIEYKSTATWKRSVIFLLKHFSWKWLREQA